MARRWIRRVTMVAIYATAWSVIQALSPVLVAALLVHDLLRRNGLASLRLLGLLWVFLLAELLGVGLAVLIWVRHGLVPGRDHDLFLEDNYRLQRWWARLLLGAGSRLLRLRWRVEGDAQAVPGPVVVLMRHTSILDTILPVVFLGARHGLRVRYVLKSELQLDPCLDIVGNRIPNCFVNRAGETEREVEAVGRMADGMGPRDGALIYPEGTRFEARKLASIQARLASKDPELHAMSLRLHRVLPPRPGGTLALLEHALPQGADVVIFAHKGLERLVRLHDVLSGAAVGSQVCVRLWRIPGAEVPEGRDARVRWLYERWEQVDAFAREDADEGAARPNDAPHEAARA
ncbi:lysophospholipid acyltransferase family protein [Paraliomyxa miuraensis]|uniref:lysophospholipid acyltransferase family protein n=1 Tax=Paraliomyxa miuraensis TaxID=376150 RepID=UPI0022517E57|nr:lysophospholipid acyltransferase family protein [Paraliomyxa miuraensis]MCX4246255.1 lysophospholipid acyltransferase family protein [Paraliomyxa miuraensis]